MLSILLKRQYNHLNVIELSRSALLHNHHALQQLHPNTAICPVLKSNAYGHGLKTLAPLFDTLHSPFLIVDSLYEAYELYKHHVHTPILILGYTHPDNFKVKKIPFHISIFDIETAQTLSVHQPGCSVHIFIDTGMHREGIQLKELPSFLNEIKSLNLTIAGLASHFADADNASSQEYTVSQIKYYKEALKMVRDHNINPQWRHISASGGAFKVQDNTFNMIRAGIASYGVSPLKDIDKENQKITLQPVLTLKTHIAQIKIIQKGAHVGYNGTYRALKKSKIAILPLGYYEGINRQFSCKGTVQIRGVDCPIIGAVSMNITTVDVTNVPHVTVGDEVVVFSSQMGSVNSIQNAARIIHMSPYELLVKLAESTYRKIAP
ncbi:MAG: alanine racemase [Candidatus Roizmanbacteria bacterium]|nr:alanine racemase [Candidatus Roizmanbacteria bacterium]